MRGPGATRLAIWRRASPPRRRRSRRSVAAAARSTSRSSETRRRSCSFTAAPQRSRPTAGSGSRSRSRTRATTPPPWCSQARSPAPRRLAGVETATWLEPLFDAAGMGGTDRWAIEERGIPSLDLMEVAGAALARETELRLQGSDRTPVRIVCGKGNNGGDGLVAARLLRDGGHRVDVLLLWPRGGTGSRRGREPRPPRRRRARGRRRRAAGCARRLRCDRRRDLRHRLRREPRASRPGPPSRRSTPPAPRSSPATCPPASMPPAARSPAPPSTPT